MRVVALLAVRNEEYYLERCLKHLYEQGLEICLIDNDSTDGTLKVAKSFLNKGVSRIEQLPFKGTYQWKNILAFKYKLSREIKADWFIHHDADEIREAPENFASLVDGINKVDKSGYNAINSEEFVFVPTSDEESFESMDYVQHMKYYYFFEPRKMHRVNIWKNTGVEVDLTSTGGHSVLFDKRLIYPENFILRHYILLSKKHAVEKYGKRKYCQEELSKGWHQKRSLIKPEKLTFPRKEDLKKISEKAKWDRSSPWEKHFFSD